MDIYASRDMVSLAQGSKSIFSDRNNVFRARGSSTGLVAEMRIRIISIQGSSASDMRRKRQQPSAARKWGKKYRGDTEDNEPGALSATGLGKG